MPQDLWQCLRIIMWYTVVLVVINLGILRLHANKLQGLVCIFP